MGTFIQDGASVLPGVKSDARAPTGAATEWAAGDANELRSAALDLRTFAISEAASLDLETANRLTGDAAIIASGVTPSNVNLSPVTATGSLTARTIADRFADVVNVKDYGAVGDGVADDWAAIQAAIDEATSTGANVVFPAGSYRVTATVNVGLPTYSAWGWMVGRTTPSDTDALTYDIPANDTYNDTLKQVRVEFAQGAVLVADWSPASPEPVFSYNLRGGAYPGGAIIGINVRPATYSSGVISSNKLIAVHAHRGCREVTNGTFYYTSHGLVGRAAYHGIWTGLQHYWGDGDSFVALATQSILISNAQAYETQRGVVYEGQSSKVQTFVAEQVVEDFFIISAECCEFGPMYLEDSPDARSRAGKYAVTVGNPAAAAYNVVNYCQFTGIRAAVGAASVKEGWAFAGVNGCTFTNCRSLSPGGLYDGGFNGNNVFDNCDFAPPAFPAFVPGAAPKAMRITNVDVDGPGQTVTFDCATTDILRIRLMSNDAWTLADPANPVEGRLVVISVQNAIGAPSGAITWGANWYGGAFTAPGSGTTKVATYFILPSFGMQLMSVV